MHGTNPQKCVQCLIFSDSSLQGLAAADPSSLPFFAPIRILTVFLSLFIQILHPLCVFYLSMLVYTLYADTVHKGYIRILILTYFLFHLVFPCILFHDPLLHSSSSIENSFLRSIWNPKLYSSYIYLHACPPFHSYQMYSCSSTRTLSSLCVSSFSIYQWTPCYHNVRYAFSNVKICKFFLHRMHTLFIPPVFKAATLFYIFFFL